MKMRYTSLCIFFVMAEGLYNSCASDGYAKIDAPAYRGNYTESLEVLEKHKKKIYKDPVLYYLDKGMLAHYAGTYAESITLLQNGEQAITAAFTKSVTKEIGSYILNDTVKEYAGEDYEDIYTNAFNALNYYHLNNHEDALVEIRRMTEKLSFLSAKYGEALTDLQARAEGSAVPEKPSGFSNSALARYLGLLFYRAGGYDDDARIDRDQLTYAFAAAPAVYAYPIPSSIDDELAIPPGKARLNVIAFSGVSPVKEQKTARVPLLLPRTRYIKIALPMMVYRPSIVGRIEASLNSGASFTLELLEDIEAVARETFKTKVNVIYLKSIIRSTLKGTASSVLGAAAEETDDENKALALSIASIATQVFAEASEQADLRISRYFPAKAYVGGITLDPGAYTLTIRYYAKNGRLLTSFQEEQLSIQENKLNLVEVVCLK